MKRITTVAATLVVAALAGCASQPPIIEMADGSFTTEAYGHPRNARTKAFDQAQEHCKKNGQRAMLVDSDSKIVTGQLSNYNASVKPYPYGGGYANGMNMPVIASNSTIKFVCK